MIKIHITIEQKDGGMGVTMSSPPSEATATEAGVFEAIHHAVTVMLALHGGIGVNLPVVPEMQVKPSRN